MVVMNRLMLTVLAAAALYGSSAKDDDDKTGKNNKDLVSPEMLDMTVSSAASFTGA